MNGEHLLRRVGSGESFIRCIPGQMPAPMVGVGKLNRELMVGAFVRQSSFCSFLNRNAAPAAQAKRAAGALTLYHTQHLPIL